MAELRKYGVATVVGFPLITSGAQDFKGTPTIDAGDVQISKDDGATWANLATLPAESAAGSKWVKVSLALAELQAARVIIRAIDQTSPKEWEDQSITIDTYGNASAQHAFDLDQAAGGQVIVEFGTTQVVKGEK